MTPRYKHRCPGCRKFLFSRVMYCRSCVATYPERRRLVLHDGQQKWLKGRKLYGIPFVEPRLVVELRGRYLCLECGLDVTSNRRHRCYTKSPASGYRGRFIMCGCCRQKKILGYFPVIIRRIRGNQNDQVRTQICSACLKGKALATLANRRMINETK